jgi:hypothetical protein
MSERAPRERLFYYALVPAILIAVFVLGTLTLRITPKIEDAQREGVLKLTYDLAGERAQILDKLVIEQDNVVAAHTDLAEPLDRPALARDRRPRDARASGRSSSSTWTPPSTRSLAFASRNPSATTTSSAGCCSRGSSRR